MSIVAFRFHGDQISSYFDLPPFHRYLDLYRVLAYLFAPLCCYIGLYALNGLLVRLFGKIELNEQRKMILKTLIEAALSEETLRPDPPDLLSEVAWISLKEYWNPE